MNIRDMFAKQIDRDIRGVIKVGQNDDSNIRQELEEYVVTHELQKHFAAFFEAYCRSIHDPTDAMGVWISGFFGSGKSHFLKILSYILDNRVVDGKKAIEYFVDDNKINDNFVLANMRKAAETSADVILFNIDSKSDMNSHNDRDAIVKVFLKVFNEKLGYCGENAYIADLERTLDAKGKLEAFKSTFEDVAMQPWDEARHDFMFVQDDIVEVLDTMGFMSEEAARNWCERASNMDYSITIENFTKLVNDYIKSKGPNHHVVFMVDEMGQYVGDNLQLLLNLQTVTEDLGSRCKGKAWVIVTSQQDINEVTKGKVKADQFSKIQGRFDTRLSLSSANVDEVIRKRILAKNDTGTLTLSALYDMKSTIIKNLITFSEGPEMKLYSGNQNFVDVYPFVPYQFNLLGNVLTSIRLNGAAGTNLADGERSMLALFKESAMKLGSRQEGALVPFNYFYDALEEFIEPSHRTVIIRAWNNDYINPNREEDCFAVNVLKTLFMVKYVREITPTVDNITTLMVSGIDDDRIALREKVEEALRRLSHEMLIQKNGPRYIFLTNEEQEIENAIRAQAVEGSEITRHVADLFFEEIYSEKKYFFPMFNNRYSFGFNQKVDDQVFKSQNYEMTVHLLTPMSEESHSEQALRMLSGQSNCVLVVLPQNTDFWEEIRTYKQIEKYFQTDAGNAAVKYEQIKMAKRQEMNDHKRNAKTCLEDALHYATIYINGNVVPSTAKDIKSRITDALGKLASLVYYKISYIDTPYFEADIRSVLNLASSQQISLDMGAKANTLALEDIRNYIEDNTSDFNKLSLKTILNRYTTKPYGFVELDVSWLIAKLFRDGSIRWTVNSETITLASKSADELVRYVTRKEFQEKLMICKRVGPDTKLMKLAKQLMNTLFATTSNSDDGDLVMADFISAAKELKNQLDTLLVTYQSRPQYPGKDIVVSGRQHLIDLCAAKYSEEFFNYLKKHQDELQDFAEDYASVRGFFGGIQKDIFDKSLLNIKLYESGKNFMETDQLAGIVCRMNTILKMDQPYGSISKLPAMNAEFETGYAAVLEENRTDVVSDIRHDLADILDYLEDKHCKEEFTPKAQGEYAELLHRTQEERNLSIIIGFRAESTALQGKLKKAIDAREEQLTPKPDAADGGNATDQTPPAPVFKKVDVKKLVPVGQRLASEADVDKYLAAIRTKLLQELQGQDYIDIVR